MIHYLTFNIQVDPGVQVLQAVVGVPTAVRPSVSGVRSPNLHQIPQSFLVQQAEGGTGPVD